MLAHNTLRIGAKTHEREIIAVTHEIGLHWVCQLEYIAMNQWSILEGIAMKCPGRCFELLVVCIAVAAAVGVGSTALAQDAPKASADKIDLKAYAEIKALRERLCLTNEALGAMGCSGEQAETVLNALVAWHGQSQADLDAVAAEKATAGENLRAALLKVQTAKAEDRPTPEAIDALQKACGDARKREIDLLKTADQAVSRPLTAAQADLLQTVRGNALPMPFRFVPNVTAEQQKALRAATARYDTKCASAKDDAEALKAHEEFEKTRDSILTSTQLAAMREVTDNLQKCMPDVLKASEKVLPEPKAPNVPVLPKEPAQN